MSSEPIRISGPDTKERRRRQRELLLAVVAIGLIVLLTWIELQFFGVNSYLFLAFFNLNLILLILILFLVLRNGVKLLLERRRRVLGTKLRSRLVLAFILLSLIPTLRGRPLCPDFCRFLVQDPGRELAKPGHQGWSRLL
jgi:two-component system nitrogen regulation sensor histidine kinase NtrY